MRMYSLESSREIIFWSRVLPELTLASQDGLHNRSFMEPESQSYFLYKPHLQMMGAA
jgi:hypothetical protein